MGDDLLIKVFKKPRLKKAIVIQGLPGMGSVGKIAVDFLVSATKAKKIAEIRSYLLPSYAFVNKENVLDVPKIEVYHKKSKGKDLLFASGEAQPSDDHACYVFSEQLLRYYLQNEVCEIITLGGIGLEHIPKTPMLYLTGTDPRVVMRYKTQETQLASEALLGPILGLTGILGPLAKVRNIPCLTILVETLGIPGYFGARGAREIIQLLNKKIGLRIDISALDKEAKLFEKEMKSVLEPAFEEERLPRSREVTNYIG
ncbi:MAG TPA: PAC2 family protein [Candidatus Nanoarchaeia archaeon]|nr:PAC2 family protein [Candidatus Nanoarchaeia archaeon]